MCLEHNWFAPGWQCSIGFITAHCSLHVDSLQSVIPKVMKHASKLRAHDSENQKPHSLTCELIHSLHILSLIAFPILCISCTLFIYVCMFVSVCVLVYSFKDNWLPPQRQTNRAMDLDTVGEACSCPSLSIDHHTHISVRLSFMLVLYANIQPPAVFQPVTEDTKGKNSLRITKLRYNAPAVRPSLPIGDIWSYFNANGSVV